MKRIAIIVLALLMAATYLGGCAKLPEEEAQPGQDELGNWETGPDFMLFTDSLGRTVELPGKIDKIAVSGPMAQLVLFALAPDKLAGIANEWDPGAENYFEEKYFNLPVLGQLYGGKGELNLESLLVSGAQVVIDVGEAKEGAEKELDELQQQTGIPFVHIHADTEGMGETYRVLGDLLGMPKEAEALASYCNGIYSRTQEMMSSVEKVRMLYCLGDKGINVIANGSYQGELIDMMSDNLAVLESPTSKGTGNEVDMEQILLWNPDVILFAPDSIYNTVGYDETWQSVAAIQTGRYYEVPYGPYNWLGFPPSVQRYLGMLWLGKLLYPEAAEYDLYQEVKEYFSLFYHCELTEEQYNAFVANSIDK